MRTTQFIKKWLYSASLLFAIACLTTSYAQKTYLPTGVHGYRNTDLERTVTDTLDENFDSATVTLYASPNGGFVGGNSGYGEIAKAQEYVVDTVPYYIDGFIYWFGYKAQQSLLTDSSGLRLKFWNNDQLATIDGLSRLIPNTVFDSTILLVQNLVADTNFAGGVNVWMLPTPRLVYNNYSAGFSMEHLHYKDTISVMSSTNGDPPVSYLCWEKWHGAWYLVFDSWGLDIDFAIFPLLDLTTASLDESPYIQGLKYSLYPNPSTDWMNIEMELENDGEYMVTVHDLSGRLIKTHNLGALYKGRISTSIEVFDLSTGNYILTLTDGKKGLSKKFVKN